MKKLFSIAHFALVIFGLILWGIGSFFYTACVILSLLVDRLIPNSTMGNCWSFSFVRWWKKGGYLAIRKADGNAFLKVLPLLHVIWLKKIDWKSSGAEVEQFLPKHRRYSSFIPWYAIYFDGKVVSSEFNHDAVIN